MARTQKIYIFSDENQITGTTTDDYVIIADIDCRMMARLALALKNSGVQSLLLKVNTQTFWNGSINFEEVPEMTLTADSVFRYFEPNLISRIVLQVKSAGVGVPTTYIVEYRKSEVSG